MPRNPMQLRIEADVRRLLRRATNPFLLASCPLAQALCEATAIPNPQSALRHAIDGAFGQGLREPRLRQMLLSAIEDGEGRVTNPNRFEVSKRHLQRRRAKAVAILALHIRRLIGLPELATIEEENEAAADPLETIAELVSSIEPATASQLLRLNGPHSAADAGMLAIRERVDVGADVDEIAGEFNGAIAAPLVAVLSAQAKEISGRQNEAAQELWPLFGRFGRDSVETPDMRFELEWLAFLRARHRGDARRMERVARSLKRLALNRASWLLRALAAQAEAKIRCGLLREADELLDEIDRRGLRNFAILDLACSSALRSEVLLQQGDDASAERLATGSYLVLRGRHIAASRCQTTIARARLRMGKAWSYAERPSGTSECAWDNLSLAVESARHSMAAGDGCGGARIAQDVYKIAMCRRYEGVAARAAAAVAFAFEPATPERREWSARALSHLLVARDRSISCDLFPFEAECNESALFNLIYQALLTAIPQLRIRSDSPAGAARSFLRDLYHYVVGMPSTREFDESIRRLDVSAPAFAQYLRYFADDAFDIFEPLIQAIVAMDQRADAERRLGLAMRAVAMLIQPRQDLRQYLVG
jgi:hypothetical protein